MPGYARQYQPDLQAARSRQLRANVNPTWTSFYRHWMAFNALYNVSLEDRERDQVKETVERYLDDQAAAAILDALVAANITPPDPPPGNTELDDSAPHFRRASRLALRDTRDARLTPRQRLAAMMALVYQVRCSLVHGNKNPQNRRDNQLVEWGLRVLERVVPVLETAMLRP
jgi:hypothetical protein